MFDSTPPNLPVEPTPGVPVLPPLVPPAGAPSPAPGMMPPVRGRKEPEDIFSGLEQSSSMPTGGSDPMMESAPRRGSPMKIVVIVVLVLVILGGIGFGVWAYFYNTSATPETATTPIVTTPITTTTPPVEQVEQPPVIDQTQPPPSQLPDGANIPAPTPIETPTSSPGLTQPVTEGIDADSDGLTDIEEAYYSADPAKSDTDGDTYLDGAEVMNLFSPASVGKSLEAETFMSRLTWNNWSLILPKPWSVVNNLPTASAGFVTTGSATRFTLDARPNPSRQSLGLWVGESAANMKSFKTKAGLDALQSQDGLTTYIAGTDTVLVVTYDLNGDTAYSYRTSYALVVNALTSIIK